MSDVAKSIRTLRATPRTSHEAEFVRLLRGNTGRTPLHTAFSDFCELAALSFSNAVDLLQHEKRETRYRAIVSKYRREEVERFPRMLAELVQMHENEFGDHLGRLFQALELSNHWVGQFFTPYPLARLMAGMSAGDVAAQVRERGFVTVSEPACGAGGMLIAFAEAVLDQGVNYQQAMHATAIDIDALAVHMAYVQLSIRHVPAIVVHGNALSLEEWGHWVTPAHVLGGWDRRLRRPAGAATTHAVPTVDTAGTVEDKPDRAETTHSAPDDLPALARETVLARRAEQLGLF